MSTSRAISLVALAGLLLTIGCGTQSSLRAAAPAANVPAALGHKDAAFFPTQPDAVWQYEVTAHPGDDPYVDYKGVDTVRVETSRKTGKSTTLNLRAIDTFTNEYRFPTLTWDDEHVVLSGVTYWGPVADRVEDLTIDFLRFPLTQGKKWDDGQWVGEILGKETVSVPAGTFQAYKVGAIGTYDQGYTAVGNYWLAPGVGVVKSDLNTGSYIFESVMIPAGRRVATTPLPAAVKKAFSGR